MKRIFLTLLIAFGSSLAITAKDAEKQCFDEGAASFAQKTKERVVIYGDKKDSKISFVKYLVKNNPSGNSPFQEDSFYMIDLPKSVLDAFSIKSWNDFLCGEFHSFAYPNTNQLTTITTKGHSASVSEDDKLYYFRTVNPNDGVITPESMDSFSLSIPGNMGYYKNYPISRIYPKEYVNNFDMQLFSQRTAFMEFVDNLISLSKIKDFEKRRSFIENLKNKGASMIGSIESLNESLDEFGDVEDSNQNTDVYKAVDSYLSTMDRKFSSTRPYMTSNGAAFAEAVHQFYQKFDKEAKRYLKKINATKNKETEKNLSDFSERTLEDAIGMIQRGIERLGHSVNQSDRQVAYLLNDYETEYSNYLEKIKSGNHGTMKIVKPILSSMLVWLSYVLDLEGADLTYQINKAAEDNGVSSIKLDDGSNLILYGGNKDGEDHRLLVRVRYENIGNLKFNAARKSFINAFVDVDYVWGNYLPPIQVVFSGNANEFNFYEGEANLLNDTRFPSYKSFSSPDAVALREKLNCMFLAVDGDMQKMKEFAGSETIKMGSGTFTKKNERFEKMLCKDGVVSYPEEVKPTIAPDAKLIIRKIPNQKVKEGKYQEKSIHLADYVKSSNCDLKDIEWIAERSKHLYAMIYVSKDVKIKADEGWCGEEDIFFTARTPKGSKIRFPIHYTVECAE